MHLRRHGSRKEPVRVQRSAYKSREVAAPRRGIHTRVRLRPLPGLWRYSGADALPRLVRVRYRRGAGARERAARERALLERAALGPLFSASDFIFHSAALNGRQAWV